MKLKIARKVKATVILLAGAVFVAGLYQYFHKGEPVPEGADRMTLARGAFARGDSARAERLVREIVSSEPSNIDARNFLAALLVASSRLAEGRETYEGTLKKDPKDYEATVGLATIFEKLGQPERAVAAWRQACQANDMDARLWRGLGLAQLKAGDTIGSMFAIRQSLRLDKEQPELRRLFTELSMARMTPDGMRPDNLMGNRRPQRGFDPMNPFPEDPRRNIRLPQVPDPLKGLPQPGAGRPR